MTGQVPKLFEYQVPGMEGVNLVMGEHMVHVFRTHIHRTYLIGQVTRGQRLLSLNGGTIAFSKGDVFLLNPGEVHACGSGGPDGHSYAVLSITPSAMAGLYRAPGHLPRFVRNALDRFQSGLQLEEICRQAKSRNHLSMVSQAIHNMFDETIRPLCVSVPEEAFLPSEGGWVGWACVYLDRHVHDTVPLDRLASLSGKSPWHFHKQFKQSLGITPHHYLMSMKIGAARKWLAQSRSISDIAYHLGFSDQSHFSRVFKQHLGVSPGRYLT